MDSESLSILPELIQLHKANIMKNLMSFFKNLLLIVTLLLVWMAQVSAQSIGKQVTDASKRSAEWKAQQKAAEATDKTIDKGVEAVENLFKKKEKKPKANKGGNSEEETEDAPAIAANGNAGNVAMTIMPNGDMDTTTAFGVYSKFTFVPGNKLIFYDDFAQEEVGDFPANWETGGTGEIVTTPGHEGKWLSILRRSGYMPVMPKELPENYTIEFDLLTSGFTQQSGGGNLILYFMEKKALAGGNSGRRGRITFYLTHSAGDVDIQNSPMEPGGTYINNSVNYDYRKKINNLIHFSINVSKRRLQIWMDEEKVVDAPTLLQGNMGRYFLMEAIDVMPERKQYALISNFRIAAAPENQRKLFDAGNTFSTTGIYFSTNSAVVKKESYGMLKVIAEAMQAEADANFEIVGHTDSDGADDFNQSLSERRAMAVMALLRDEFGISGNRITTSGKGETQPVDDNITMQGKANNRRVEIIKK
jgi:OmpA-OmpF porin, OOP family